MSKLTRQDWDETRLQRMGSSGPEVHTRCCSCAEKFWAPYRDDVDPLVRRYCASCMRNPEVSKQAPGGRRAFQLPFNDYEHETGTDLDTDE